MTQKHYEEAYRSFYENINRYDLIQVIERNEMGKERTYMINGISMFRNNPLDISFTRTFANTVEVPGLVTAIEEESNTLFCGNTFYIFHPIKKRDEMLMSTLAEKITIDDLMSREYIDEACVERQDNSIYSTVSLNKLGNLTKKQKLQIKMLINQKLGGISEYYQHCRVPAFSVEFLPDEEYNIYGHIYSFDENKYMNKILVYKSKEDFMRLNLFDEFATYMKSLYDKHFAQ